jgi:hypothetical protein
MIRCVLCCLCDIVDSAVASDAELSLVERKRREETPRWSDDVQTLGSVMVIACFFHLFDVV